LLKRFPAGNAQTYKCYPAIGGQAKPAVIFEVHHLGNRRSLLHCSTFISPAMGRHTGLQQYLVFAAVVGWQSLLSCLGFVT